MPRPACARAMSWRWRGGGEDPDALHYVFFISDGVANVGDTRAESIIESLGGQRAEANPIRLVAVGVGIDQLQ